MPGVRFGHAATIVEGEKGTAKGKAESLKRAGIRVAESFSNIVPILKEYL
jgi:succinyl-CoA synthetase alpha subunit